MSNEIADTNPRTRGLRDRSASSHKADITSSENNGLSDVENLEEIQDEIDVLNVMLKLMDTQAVIAYQKFNKPVLGLWRQYYPAKLSKKPWRFHFRHRMACFTSFDRLKERVEHLMEDHRSGVECRLSGHR